jgi:hypothetical protein
VRSSYRKAGYGCNVVKVLYKYSVADERFRSTHTEPFMVSNTGSYLRKFSAGTPITVRFKADDPARSVALI